MSTQTHLSAVILTALPLEYLAVRMHLTDLQEEIHPEGTLYERGVFIAENRRWEVGIAETRQGSANAAFEAGRAIDYFKPQVVFFVGIAGGLKDVRIGDVVAATVVYGYESGKASTTFLPRPEVGQSTYRMTQRAQKEARSNVWLRRVTVPKVTPEPCVFVNAIAAGEKVMDSTRSATYQFLRQQYSNALAVEMEGHGFLQATHANQHVEALIIRGISDLIDNKSQTDQENSQELAANHASAFAFEVLSKLTPQELQGSIRKPPSGPSSPKPAPARPIRMQTGSGDIIAPTGDYGHNIINYTLFRATERERRLVRLAQLSRSVKVITMQQSINTTMDTEEIQDSVDGDESAFYKPEKHRATISQETLSGNIYSPSGDHQHVVININNINNNNYYDVIHKAKRIAEQEKSNNDPIKSLEEDLAFEQQTRVSFNDRASTHQSNTIPTTEEAIAEWFYALDTYEQQYTFTTAILHGAPAHIISKHAEELYKGIKEHEIRFYTIPPTQTNAESLTALPKQHHSSIESLRKRTYTVMHQSQGIACIYWADTDAYGYSPFNSRILAFLSKEFTNKGSYGEFFLSKVKSWANNRDSDYDYWLAAKALGSILRITNVQQLQKQADEFAKQGSVIGHRRTASLLAGAYDSEQQEQLSEPHSSPVLTILDRWTKKVYQNPKAQSNILLGRTIAHSYSFIGREKPEIALQETAQLLKELPIEDLNCAASLSSACISTYVSLTWSGHLRKVLCNLAKIFEELLDQWSATDKLSQREYERQQREYCLRKTNNTFFLILAATIHLEGYTTPVETYTQQLPAERIQIAELNYNIFIAAILQNDPLKEAILKLFRSAIITAHSQAAMMFLRNWSETVINIYKQKQDQQTNDLYSTYIAFLSHIGQEIQQWEQKWRKHGHYPTSLSKVYQRHLMQWQKEGKRHNPYLEQMASAILQHISTQYSKSEVTA